MPEKTVIKQVERSSSLEWIPLQPHVEGCYSDVNPITISKIALANQTGTILAQDSVHSAVYEAVRVGSTGKLQDDFDELEASYPEKKVIATVDAIITADDVQQGFTTEPIPGTDKLLLRPKVWQFWVEIKNELTNTSIL